MTISDNDLRAETGPQPAARVVGGLVQSGVDDDGEAGIMCWRCDHPGATTEEYLTYLAETLDRDRWVVQYVVSEHQPSAYTVGLHGLGLPELLVTGLPEKISVQLLDSAAHEMADHDTRLEPGRRSRSIIPTCTSGSRNSSTGACSARCSWCGPTTSGTGRGTADGVKVDVGRSRCSGRAIRCG
jgi:hypothetical protein